MDPMQWLLILVLLIGLVGTVIPMIPGMGLIFVGILIYGFYSGWSEYSVGLVGFSAIITVLCLLIDYFSGIFGAKKFGADKSGMIGAAAGAVLGLIFFQAIGMMIGGAVGVILVEWYNHEKDIHLALKAAAGLLIGTAFGAVVQFVLALIVVIWTIIAIF